MACADGVPEFDAEALATREYDRPHTLAQLGFGVITLPGAELCLHPGQCTKGDTSLDLNFWQLYRPSRSFGIGAGASLALNPTVDNPQSDTRTGNVPRDHTRSYFSVEGQARYYALRMHWIELWVGGTVGGVIISDRYTVSQADESGPQPAIIGPRSNTIRTEGVTVGALMGAQWAFAHNWALGASLRYARWFLPQSAATSVFLDSATLTGEQDVLYVGLLCSYRIAL